MNVIIVAKPHAQPTSLNLNCWRMRSKIACAATVFIGLVAGAGFAGALLFANPRDRSVEEVQKLRAQIAAQRDSLKQLEATSQRNVDALAVQLGEIQAQTLRLNALGQRLATVGKLDDGEFDFSQPPALGGAEDPEAKPHSASFDVGNEISKLRSTLDGEETQLTVLEDMLMDRRVDSALRPAGYPVVEGYIGSGFGERSDPINGAVEHHLGLDFDAPVGTNIRAVADGVVTWTGDKAGYGNVVEIDHGNGYMTRYAHNSKNLARVGERVHAGDVIARVGSTGRATGPHCHFEVWLNGRAVNPLSYVNAVVKRT
jgi:murein DD-endopeptidase MepM/ murein hydrolase activator NlpD